MELLLIARILHLSIFTSLSLLGLASNAQAQNLPPVAEISVNKTEAWVGEVLSFSGAASLDPDDSPEPLSYSWDFFDDNGGTGVEINHSFETPGAYAVNLSVSDGLNSSVAGLTVTILDPPQSATNLHSSPILLDESEERLFVVNPDSNSISVLHWLDESLTLEAEVSVGQNPRTLALSPDGSKLFVSAQGSHELWLIDTQTLEISQSIAVGLRPYAVLVLPDSGRILVSNQGEDTVSILAADGSILAILPVADGPRAMAVDMSSQLAYVTHYISRDDEALLSVLDLSNLSLKDTIVLSKDPTVDTPSSGGGTPNLLSSAVIEPGGRLLWLGGLKSNSGRGTYKSGVPLTPKNTLRALVAPIDLWSTEVQDLVSRRLDPNDADRVSAVAFSPSGRYAYLLHQGLGELSVYDIMLTTLIDTSDGGSVPYLKRLEVGDAPQGIVVNAGGSRAYVWNFLGRNVVELDLSDPTDPQILNSLETTSESLAAEVLTGKKLFFRSRAPIHSDSGYVACASCHADGHGEDGRVWDFSQFGEGLRNTIDLAGRAGLEHGPVHWSGNNDEIQDIGQDLISKWGGIGLLAEGLELNEPLGESNRGMSAELDALAAYVESLDDLPRSPQRSEDGNLSAAALRGKTLFDDPEIGCVDCHFAPTFTNSIFAPDVDAYAFYDVGTLRQSSGKRLGEALTGLDTPTLIGLWDTGPYLHDGSANDLQAVFTSANPSDQHGQTSQLSAEDIDDLVAFLLSIDGPLVAAYAEEEAAASVSGENSQGCACTSAEPIKMWVVLFWSSLYMLGFMQRRRRTRR
jgi:YVTN family beta-propeller protein